jgi:hypothetical protein
MLRPTEAAGDALEIDVATTHEWVAVGHAFTVTEPQWRRQVYIQD